MATSSDYDKTYAEISSALNSNPSDNLFQEPPSAADPDHPPQSPFNQTWDSESGHSIQLDDTPGRERVRIQHGKSKNFIEMHPDGKQVIKVFGEGFDITIGKKNIYVTGACNIVVKGNCNMQVDGNFNTEVNGDYNLAVKGKLNMRSVKDTSISSDANMSVAASEKFGGRLRFGAAQSLTLSSNLTVAGKIQCDSLHATTRVNAGTGVLAGPDGFTSQFGGLSLGRPTPLIPVASKGCIDIIGSITALGSVTAPVGNFLKTNVGLATNGISSSILGADLINDILYNFHIHPTPKGPSGLTTAPSMSA
jgi:hypothetical protein